MKNNSAYAFQVEEEIEEVTEEYFSDDETKTRTSRSFTKNGPWLSPHPSLRNSVDFILADSNDDGDQKEKVVPFPEFGVDIVVVHHKNGTYQRLNNIREPLTKLFYLRNGLFIDVILLFFLFFFFILE